jgi:hypothetical protein
MHSSHMLRECARTEVVRDNMGHVDIQRDPESLRQELVERAGGRLCRKMYAPALAEAD